MYFDLDSKPSHFLPPPKTKSNLIPTMKSSQLRFPTLRCHVGDNLLSFRPIVGRVPPGRAPGAAAPIYHRANGSVSIRRWIFLLLALRLFLFLLLLLVTMLLLLRLRLLLLLLFTCLLPQIFLRRLFRDRLLWQLLIPHVPVALLLHLFQIYFAPVRPPERHLLSYISSPMQFHLLAFTFPNYSIDWVFRSSSRRLLVMCFCFGCCFFNIPDVSPDASAKHGTPIRCSPATALRWFYFLICSRLPMCVADVNGASLVQQCRS